MAKELKINIVTLKKYIKNGIERGICQERKPINRLAKKIKCIDKDQNELFFDSKMDFCNYLNELGIKNNIKTLSNYILLNKKYKGFLVSYE